VINEFNEVNHLGIIIDNKLQFNSNCNQIVKKAYKNGPLLSIYAKEPMAKLS
jgi:hypothetical protein